MAGKSPTKPKGTADREDRLKAALKANLARRKAQARARGPGGKAAQAGKDKNDG